MGCSCVLTVTCRKPGGHSRVLALGHGGPRGRSLVLVLGLGGPRGRSLVLGVTCRNSGDRPFTSGSPGRPTPVLSAARGRLDCSEQNVVSPHCPEGTSGSPEIWPSTRRPPAPGTGSPEVWPSARRDPDLQSPLSVLLPSSSVFHLDHTVHIPTVLGRAHAHSVGQVMEA